MSDPLKTTVLHAAHKVLGARMVAFAGYDMPVQYRDGVLKEHLWTRAHVGAFDVSHMGPAFLTLTDPSGDQAADHRVLSALIEPLVCGDLAGLKPGQIRYTLLLNDEGGLIDDLMIARTPLPAACADHAGLYIVVNAATKAEDFVLIEAACAGRAVLRRADDGGLIALQGPQAADVLSTMIPQSAELGFMQMIVIDWRGSALWVSRCGYTGEDGFEILVPALLAESFWDELLADQRVRPVGLGARDSLRLEAGLPLYGHDADPSVSPIEARLDFAVSGRRLKAGDIAGAARIARERGGDLSRVRVGLKVLEGAPAREGAQIADQTGAVIGKVTSGGFSPSLGAPIAMGFVPPALAAPGTPLKVLVRGKAQPAQVAALPFVPHRYVRNP